MEKGQSGVRISGKGDDGHHVLSLTGRVSILGLRGEGTLFAGWAPFA